MKLTDRLETLSAAELGRAVVEHLWNILLRAPYAVGGELHKLPFRPHPATKLRAVDVSAQDYGASPEQAAEERTPPLRILRLPEQEPVGAPCV